VGVAVALPKIDAEEEGEVDDEDHWTVFHLLSYQVWHLIEIKPPLFANVSSLLVWSQYISLRVFQRKSFVF